MHGPYTCTRSSQLFGGSTQQQLRKQVARQLRVNGTCSTSRRKPPVMMPVGVPRVVYKTPQENTWQWVDLWNCLYRERIVFLQKPVDDEIGNQVISVLLYLDSVNKTEINFYINSAGGEVVPTLAIHDCMKHIDSKCGTLGIGACMGMSGFILATGEKGKRRLMRNTRIMLHHPSGAARGQASDIHNEARELLYLRDYMTAILSTATGRPFPEVFKDFRRNRYFNAQEALEYGLVDVVLSPPRREIL